MKKIDLGQTISIFANLGVIAGITFLALELNQNTAQLALGNKPTLAAHRAQYTTLSHLFTEAAEQLLLRLIWAQFHCRQRSHLLLFEKSLTG